MIITILRLFQGYLKLDLWNRMKRQVKPGKRDSLFSSKNKLRNWTKTEKFEWLEKKVLETVIK